MITSRDSARLVGAAAVVLMFAIKSLAWADQTSAVATYAVSNTIVAIELESSAKAYRVGEPILLRVGLKNVAAQPYAFFQGTPWRHALLIVSYKKGSVVAPMRERDATDYHGLVGLSAVPVQPGEVFWMSWGTEAWSDMSHWGYDKLLPGVYSVRAVPLVEGFLAPPPAHRGQPQLLSTQGRFMTDLKTVNSNQIEITVNQ